LGFGISTLRFTGFKAVKLSLGPGTTKDLFQHWGKNTTEQGNNSPLGVLGHLPVGQVGLFNIGWPKGATQPEKTFKTTAKNLGTHTGTFNF